MLKKQIKRKKRMHTQTYNNMGNKNTLRACLEHENFIDCVGMRNKSRIPNRTLGMQMYTASFRVRDFYWNYIVI